MLQVSGATGFPALPWTARHAPRQNEQRGMSTFLKSTVEIGRKTRETVRAEASLEKLYTTNGWKREIGSSVVNFFVRMSFRPTFHPQPGILTSFAKCPLFAFRRATGVHWAIFPCVRFRNSFVCKLPLAVPLPLSRCGLRPVVPHARRGCGHPAAGRIPARETRSRGLRP